MGEHILPDILGPDLDVVFVGTSVGGKSKDAGSYYKHPNNRFWRWLHTAGFTPNLLKSENAPHLPAFGIGLTDLSKTVSQSYDGGPEQLNDFDCQGLVDRLAPYAPKVVAFNGKFGVDNAFKRFVGHRGDVRFGAQEWLVGESLAFVLPSSSGRLSETDPLVDTSYRSRPPVDYWHELAAFLDR